MILLTGIVLAIFVAPDGWQLPVIIGFAVLEVAETAFTWRYSRRFPPKVGPETLIGAEGRVVRECRPRGTVRVRGEVWQAHCTPGASVHERIRVVSRERLILHVEPLE